MRRHGPTLATLLCVAVSLPSLADAQTVADAQSVADSQSVGALLSDLKRWSPGARSYVCPAFPEAVEPAADDRARAAQVASRAQEAFILGDLERAEALLSEAAERDRTSAEYAYQRARVLEVLNRPELALEEYCRAIALGGEKLGPPSATERIDSVYESVRPRLPDRAEQAFAAGLAAADGARWAEAIESFSVAVELAPSWTAPLYNRGLIFEHVGAYQEALGDFRAYIAIITEEQATASRQRFDG